MTVVPIARYFNPAMTVDVLGTSVKFRDGAGLNMGFRISRTMTQTPDTCEVQIEGLDPVRVQTMSALFAATGASTVKVQAGYDKLTAGIFAGDLRSFVGPVRRGAAEVVTIVADDGGNAFSDVVIRLSSAGLTASQMIDIAAAAMQLQLHPSVPLVLAQSDQNKQGAFTAVMVGKASDLLTAACRRIRCRWWIRDGQIVLGFRGQPDSSRPAVVIPVSAIVSGPSTQGSGLFAVTAFMDPNVVPGSQVVLESLQLRVEAVVYSGETRGGLWTAQITGRKL